MTTNDMLVVGLYLIAGMVITLANLAAIWTILGNKKLRNTTNFFITSLSMSYLLTGAAMVPLFVIITFFGNNFNKNTRCNYYLAVTFFNNLTGYCCAYSQLGIAIDRFRAIVTPFKKNFTHYQAQIFVVLIWALSTVAALPTLLILLGRKSERQMLIDSKLYCQFMRVEHLLIISLQISIGCGFPVLACCLLYGIVIARLWSRGKTSVTGVTKKPLVYGNPSKTLDSKTYNGTAKSRSIDDAKVSLVLNNGEDSSVTTYKYYVKGKKFSMVSFAEDTKNPAKSTDNAKPLVKGDLNQKIAFRDMKISFIFEHLHNILIMTDHWLHVGVYLYFNTSFRHAFIATFMTPMFSCCSTIFPKICASHLTKCFTNDDETTEELKRENTIMFNSVSKPSLKLNNDNSFPKLNGQSKTINQASDTTRSSEILGSHVSNNIKNTLIPDTLYLTSNNLTLINYTFSENV
ncbi:unnamed protein product [Gordionus sp. m RMFG-2023]